ncbi:MAG: drug/metabolite transporter (DMT)-like permease [Oleispira sp.]|jgi:drug/metabolite transporter (DMT)-like permease
MKRIIKKIRNQATNDQGFSDLQKGYGFAFAAALIWAGFILVSRVGGISELSAFDVIAIRYGTCAAILLPIWWFKFRFTLFTPRLIICSLVGGLAYALCAFSGFQLSSASHAAILLPGMMPLFIIALSFLINKESHGTQKWLGVGVITLGIVVLFAGELGVFKGEINFNVAALLGDSWLVAAAFFWAVFSVLIKRWQITPWQVTVSLALLTCLFYLPVYIVFLPKALSAASWESILLQAFYQGIMATIVQMIFYVKAVQNIGPSNMGAVMSIVPVISGLAAIVIFNEQVTVELIMGLVLVSLGAWVAHSRYFARKKSLEIT